MDFYDVLERVLALLQQPKRLTYRTLQRQFTLDEAYLEDLQAEIIEARQLAVDEEGRVLVWTAGVDATAASAVSGAQAGPRLAAPPDRSPHAAAEAERRQLTVLFCDLVDSTSLARHLWGHRGSRLRSCASDAYMALRLLGPLALGDAPV